MLLHAYSGLRPLNGRPGLSMTFGHRSKSVGEDLAYTHSVCDIQHRCSLQLQLPLVVLNISVMPLALPRRYFR